MLVTLRSAALMALAAISVSASPKPMPEELVYRPYDNTTNAAGYDFQYRFYSNGGCDHSTSDDFTYPPDSAGPNQGTKKWCYSAPLGINWNRLEIDVFFPNGPGYGIYTYCNVNCESGDSRTGKQQNTNCYVPYPGCAIGSFVIDT